MTQSPSRNSERIERLGLDDSNKPIIRILLYTDDPNGITATTDLFGLSRMIDHIKTHLPEFADISTTWMSRYSRRQDVADNKLTRDLLNQFDEIWFFGLHHLKLDRFSAILGGGPESELDPEEIAVLQEWMSAAGNNSRGGGVLMTGDHANRRDPFPVGSPAVDPCNRTEPEEFFGLGRALGQRVPRAGQLRKWEGPPTSCKKDSFNTQAPKQGIDIDSLRLQIDRVPQQLILRTFSETGDPMPGGRPHPLFFFKGDSMIEVFPDHAHEGAIIIPAEFDEEIWPKVKGVQPKPQVVASGIDKRNARLLDLVAAYNGDSANVGRIVADSTWHHYLNINLTQFQPPATEGSAADQIGQFYANLALWLSPRTIRVAMAHEMLSRLANHPMVLQEIGGNVVDVGRAGYSLVSRRASPCEIHELIQAAVPGKYRERFETMSFPATGVNLGLLPSTQLILGCTIEWIQREIARVDSLKDSEPPRVANAIESGFHHAFNTHAAILTETASQAKRLIS
ncbi:MAG TPA: hypothetical protein VFV34_11065 [Blastocatellia bacterium]|nr:hypothetical protein [Blastocatellia bacterium]